MNETPSTSPATVLLYVARQFSDATGARRLAQVDGLEQLLRTARVAPGGRAPGHVVDAGEWPVALRIRSGHRGGWLAPLLGDRHGSPRRLEREWKILTALSSASAPTPAPVFAMARRSGPFWRTWFATRNHGNAMNALDRLRSWDARPPARRAVSRREAARVIGRAIRQVHDAGVVHGDLNLSNLLLDAGARGPEDAGECLLVDFDHAQRKPSVSPQDRLSDLMRLTRSCEKESVSLSRREIAAALAAYCGGDRGLRRDLLSGVARERRRIARHRWFWRAGRRRTRSGAAGRVAAFLALFVAAACEPAPEAPAPESPDVRVSFFAVGDTGRTRPFPRLFEGQLAVARAMARQAEHAPADALILLGDNFYTDGLTRNDLVERIRANVVVPYCFLLRLDGPRSAEVESACDVPPEARHPAAIFAVLGNHDLETEGSAALQRDEVPDFVPGWRMARRLAETVRLAEGVDLILFESEPRIHEREAVMNAVRDAILASDGPWRILATHRPIATDDFGRPRLGGYPRFVLDGIEAAGRPVQLVLAAHHHNLQVFEVGPPTASLQLGLGSGARAEPPLASDDHPAARFGLEAPGFARIDLVGRGADARLIATLFSTPRWPILDRFFSEKVVARYAVDVHGAVEAMAPSSPRRVRVGQAR